MTNKNTVKTRFCPSPTGLMHIGNVRTALFSYLHAVSQSGHFLLRIEDTDKARSEDEFTDLLMQDLKWLSLDWDEGPTADKSDLTYFQSARESVYQKYYDELLATGAAYPCFCTEAELTISRKAQIATGKAPRYSGKCRHLTPKERERLFAERGTPSLRFAMKRDEKIEFVDGIQGTKQFMSNDIGDFVIQKSDGGASFMFCNAIDDSLMGVTHVIRGEDHLTNTPRQLMILKVLGLRTPTYAHMALIVGMDGKPLSKRNGSQSMQELREQGYFPIAIANYLSRLGHSYDNSALMSLLELGLNFKMSNVARTPARYDGAQLDYWQKEVVMRMEIDDLEDWLGQTSKDLVPFELWKGFLEMIRPNIIKPIDAVSWASRLFGDEVLMDDSERQIAISVGPQFWKEALNAVDTVGANFKALTECLSETLGIRGKGLMQPLRIGLTGVRFGPEMAKIVELLGPNRLKQKFELMFAIASNH